MISLNLMNLIKNQLFSFLFGRKFKETNFGQANYWVYRNLDYQSSKMFTFNLTLMKLTGIFKN